MQKSAISAVFGLMLIIIIIETTSLTSTFPQTPGGNASPFLVPFFPSVTSEPLTQKVPLAAEPVKTADTGITPVATQTIVQAGNSAGVSASDQPVLPSDAPASDMPAASAGSDKVNGNTMAGNWGHSNGLAVPAPTLPAVPPAASIISKAPQVELSNPIQDSDDNYTDFWRASVLPEVTLPPEDMVEIFHQDQVYEYNTTAVTFTLRNAPMKIVFNVTARNQTDVKWSMDRSVKKTSPDGILFNVTRVDPNSWFILTVYDKNNGNAIVDKEGFGGIYDQNPDKEIIIRNTGTYQIQMAGGYVTANVIVSVPRNGNS